MADFHHRFAADHRSLSEARAAINAWVASAGHPVELDEVRAADVDVVVTELAANVVDHTESSWFSVTLAIDRSRLRVEVANDSSHDPIPPVAHWGALAEDDRGRGLRIVRNICDRISVSGSSETTAISCEIDLS